MKRQWKGFLAGVMFTMLLLGFAIPALAAYQKTVTLHYNDVKVTLNGQQITPKDESGNSVEPFLMDGTTYLPVRGLASALGLKVSWNQNSQTVALSSSNATNTSTAKGTEQTIYPAQLTAGLYVVGKDVAPGRYNATATAGSGEFIVIDSNQTSAKANEIFGVDGPAWYFSDLSLSNGDQINITNDLVVTLTPVS